MAVTPYLSVRPSIRSGDVLAFRTPHGALDWAISHWTAGAYVHVGLAWRWPSSDRLFVLEATRAGGVGIRALSWAQPCDLIATGVDWTEAAERLATDSLGLPYSLGDALDVALGFTPPPQGAICSTYCAHVLAAAGLALPTRGLTPQALVNDLIDGGRELRRIS